MSIIEDCGKAMVSLKAVLLLCAGQLIVYHYEQFGLSRTAFDF